MVIASPRRYYSLSTNKFNYYIVMANVTELSYIRCFDDKHVDYQSISPNSKELISIKLVSLLGHSQNSLTEGSYYWNSTNNLTP